MSDLQHLITRVFEHAAGRPMWEVMREDEMLAGNAVILPGDFPWLSTEGCDPTIIVSQSGKEIRLIALLARNPGHGVFRRTVSGIIASGLVPVIIAPVVQMRETMKRWNWYRRDVGSGWNHEEQWRPRKGWSPPPDARGRQP